MIWALLQLVFWFFAISIVLLVVFYSAKAALSLIGWFIALPFVLIRKKLYPVAPPERRKQWTPKNGPTFIHGDPI